MTIPEILQEHFEMRKTDKDYRTMSREIGSFLNSLKGWRKIGVKKNKLYGVQKAWERIEPNDSENPGYLLNNL